MSSLDANDILRPDRLAIAITGMRDWSIAADGRALERTLVFEDFRTAFAFMTKVAEEAERLNHHPEWCNVWNRVDIELATHSAGGVTERDLELAKAIDGIAADYELSCSIDGMCGGCS